MGKERTVAIRGCRGRVPFHILHFLSFLCVLGALCGPVLALLEVRGGRLVDDGVPVFLRAAMYYQPHAFHQHFWPELDEALLAPDLEKMKQQGLNTIVLQVDWGAFMPAVDVRAETFTWDEASEKKLLRILELAREKEMYVILWFSWARAPEGVGAKPYEASRDLGGTEHAAFSGYLLHDYPALAIENTFAWKACLAFHERIARLTEAGDDVILDPLDWQHLNMSYWSWADAGNLAAWREYVKLLSGAMDWNREWGDENAVPGEALLPVDSHVQQSAAKLPDSPYAGLPVDPYGGAKWQDFNDWHDGVFVRIARQIVRALERGNPQAPIGQRLDTWRYGQWRPRTWAPWHREGDRELAPGRFYFLTYYPRTREDAGEASAKLTALIQQVRARDRWGYPIMMWEMGIDVAELYPGADAKAHEEAQHDYLDAVAATTERLGLLGFGWWVWRDYYMSAGALEHGLVRVDGTEKQAVELLKWGYGPEAASAEKPGAARDEKKPRPPARRR